MTDDDIKGLLARQWTPPPASADAVDRLLAAATPISAAPAGGAVPPRWRWLVPGGLLAASIAAALVITLARPTPAPVSLDDPLLQGEAMAQLFGPDPSEEWM